MWVKARLSCSVSLRRTVARFSQKDQSGPFETPDGALGFCFWFFIPVRSLSFHNKAIVIFTEESHTDHLRAISAPHPPSTPKSSLGTQATGVTRYTRASQLDLKQKRKREKALFWCLNRKKTWIEVLARQRTKKKRPLRSVWKGQHRCFKSLVCDSRTKSPDGINNTSPRRPC